MKKYLLLGALAFTPLAHAGENPHQVVEDYFKYIGTGDVASASKLVTDKLHQNDKKFMIESKIHDINKRHGGVTRVNVTDDKVTDEAVTLSVAITYRDKTTAKKLMSVRKESGGWKLRDL